MNTFASIKPDHKRLENKLQAWLGPNMAVVCTDVDGLLESLWPEERAAIANAIPRRQQEFAAGRAAARHALSRLGIPSSSLCMQPDRCPKWPASVVGSISHTQDCCIAIVGYRCDHLSIGVDVEWAKEIDRNLWPAFCTQKEISLVDKLPSHAQSREVLRIFSAKEAVYKWQYPQTKKVIGFHEMEIFSQSDQDFEYKLLLLQGTQEHRDQSSVVCTSLDFGHWILTWVIQ